MNFPLAISLADSDGLTRNAGSIGATPAEFFTRKSQALSSPGAKYYVDVTAGKDTNDGQTEATAFKSIWRAVATANAGGVPAAIYVRAGTYGRVYGFWFNSGVPVWPTVDIAFVATGGRVIAGTFDSFTAPTKDTVYANCYSLSMTNVERVVDRTRVDDWSDYVELQNVATAETCDATADSWALVSGRLYIHRGDDAAVTAANTRIYRGNSETLLIREQVNVYLGGADAESGFDLEGGGNNASLNITCPSPRQTRNLIVVDNMSISQAGGITYASSRSVSFNSFNGLILLHGVRASGSQTDSFNAHNSYASPQPPALLTVNCNGFNPGRPGQTSCNNFTLHEDCIGIDVAGDFEESHGGGVRNIGTSKCLLAGTFVKNDRGDQVLSAAGLFQPTAIAAQDSATIWCDSVKVDMPADTHAYMTHAVDSTILKRNCAPVSQPDAGPGTFGTY